MSQSITRNKLMEKIQLIPEHNGKRWMILSIILE